MASIEAIKILRGTVGPSGPVEAGDYLLVGSEVTPEDAGTLVRLERAEPVKAADARTGRAEAAKAEAEAEAAAAKPDSAAPAVTRTR